MSKIFGSAAAHPADTTKKVVSHAAAELDRFPDSAGVGNVMLVLGVPEGDVV